MIRGRIFAAVTIALLIVSGYSLTADVKSDEKSLVKFEGMLGKVVNLFGGRAAREGVRTSVAVKGDRKASITDTAGQIIDLKEEKIYDLDVKKKTYKAITFAELRRRMEEARKKAEEDTQVVQERRAGLIDRLLNAANKPGEKTKAEGTPVKEVAPAK